MRLEYTDEQEKQLRITEIEAVLNNELYENEIEEYCLDIELQFLQGNVNSYGEPYAFIGTDSISFDVIYEEKKDNFSATIYDQNGNPQRPYFNSENIEKLVRKILKEVAKYEYWIYVLYNDTYGVVKANTEEDAKQKVKEAYTKHGGYETGITENMIEIENMDNHWFSNSPDVIEVCNLS